MIFASFGKNPAKTLKYRIFYPDFSVGAKYIQPFQGYKEEGCLYSSLAYSNEQTTSQRESPAIKISLPPLPGLKVY